MPLDAYVQITTRCNLACGHCAYACTAEGEDMGGEVFAAACALARARGLGIVLGGGEPTLHPQWWAFLQTALEATAGGRGVWLATNGTRREAALRLAALAREGVVGVCLSRTPWHLEQAIQPHADVLAAFDLSDRPLHYKAPRMRGDFDRREVSRIAGLRGTPVAIGRAAAWGDAGCCCPSLHVAPAGEIYACGCRRERFGTVFAPAIPDEYWRRDPCRGAMDKL